MEGSRIKKYLKQKWVSFFKRIPSGPILILLFVTETLILLTVRDTLILLSDINPYKAHRDVIDQAETFQIFDKTPLQVATPTSLDGCVYETLDIKILPITYSIRLTPQKMTAERTREYISTLCISIPGSMLALFVLVYQGVCCTLCVSIPGSMLVLFALAYQGVC